MEGRAATGRLKTSKTIIEETAEGGGANVLFSNEKAEKRAGEDLNKGGGFRKRGITSPRAPRALNAEELGKKEGGSWGKKD